MLEATHQREYLSYLCQLGSIISLCNSLFLLRIFHFCASLADGRHFLRWFLLITHDSTIHTIYHADRVKKVCSNVPDDKLDKLVMFLICIFLQIPRIWGKTHCVLSNLSSSSVHCGTTEVRMRVAYLIGSRNGKRN